MLAAARQKANWLVYAMKYLLARLGPKADEGRARYAKQK